jgi:Domain of Unknown Function (DUF928)
MTWFRNPLCKKIAALILASVIASFLVFSSNQIAQAAPIQIAQIPNPIGEFLYRLRLRTNPPRSAIATGRVRPGAGRGSICAFHRDEQSDQGNQITPSIMALAPVGTVDENGNVIDSGENEPLPETGFVGGFTIAAQPTFWFYVPYILTSDLASETSSKRVAQFVLLDDSNHPVWNELMNVELQDHPRLVEYPLPYTLETGRLYNWYFSILCDSDKLSRNPTVRGWVQRIAPTPELQLALRDAMRFQQYEAYADNGLWFDTVNAVVNIRRQFPFIHRDIWTGLLTYFEIPDANQLDILESAEPTEREVVSGNQLPARMYGDQ